MNQKQLITYFKKSFGKLTPSTNGWYRFNSPLDSRNDNSAAVNFDCKRVKDFRNIDGSMSCYRFLKLTKSISYQDLAKTLENLPETTLAKTEVKQDAVALPEGYRNIYTPTKEGDLAR